MWRWALVVGMFSFVVGMLGWSSDANGGPGTEKVLFCVFLVMFVAAS